MAADRHSLLLCNVLLPLFLLSTSGSWPAPSTGLFLSGRISNVPVGCMRAVTPCFSRYIGCLPIHTPLQGVEIAQIHGNFAKKIFNKKALPSGKAFSSI